MGFTPATVKPTDSAKKAMPNDMANLGWRTVAQIGSIWLESEACARFHHEMRGWGARSLSAGAGCQRPLWMPECLLTRPAGGSTSVRPFSQLRPASASANSGPHAEQPGSGPGNGRVRPGQDAVEGVREQGIELVALQPVFWSGLASHHLPIGTL